MGVRKKTCGAPDCNERIKIYQSYCNKHFALLPQQIRSDMIEARRISDGKLVLDASKRAIEFYENYKEKQKVTTGKSDIIDVMLEPRMVKGAAQAFWQGDMREDSTGSHREVWIWLPLSQIKVGDKDDNGVCEVSMPEWLGIDKGLV